MLDNQMPFGRYMQLHLLGEGEQVTRGVSAIVVSFAVAISVFSSLGVSSLHAQETTADGRTIVRPPNYNEESITGPIVKEIEIEFAGSRSVDRSVVVSNMRTSIGQPYSRAAIEEDVRNLYATGLFVNLRIYDEPYADGVKVIVVVQPKPIIKQVVVQNAKAVKESAIRKKISSKPGDPLSEQKVAADAREIEEYYLGKGFPDISVEYKIDINEQVGRAVVTYTLQEGERGFVRSVTFEGVKAFEVKELQKLMKTKPKNWLHIFNKSGILKDAQFQEDLRTVRAYYQDNGYIDMVVQDTDVDFEAGDINITIKIFEGIQYKVGNINFRNNTLFSRDQIVTRMRMLTGKVFSPSKLQEDVQAVRDLYGERGYIETIVNPTRQPNIQSGRMDLLYSLSEGDQSFIEKIVIQGNNNTKDKVVRRELALSPGDVYDSVRVDASKRRLQNLGYFSKVDVSAQDTSVPNRKNMVITVEEQRTGSVTFGAGFSTVDSLMGFVEITQGNFDIANPPSFVGAGQKFRTRIQYGLRRQDFIISWTEPWFMNRRLSLGFDGFYNNAQFLSSEYNQRRYGGSMRLGRAINQFWRIDLKYTFENIEIYDLDSDVSNIIRAEAGTRTKSSVEAALTYDTRDSFQLTRSGERVRFAVEGAGGPIMGDTDIWKLSLQGQKWWELPYDMIFTARGTTTVVDHYEDTNRVPIFDRLFVGGSKTVRGFDFRDVGPRDSTGEPIGGRTSAYTNLELTFPIFDKVRGAVFSDAGINNDGVFDYSLSDVEVSAGFGVRLDLPIGPLRFDLGFPVVHTEENNHLMKFHFDVGYQF